MSAHQAGGSANSTSGSQSDQTSQTNGPAWKWTLPPNINGQAVLTDRHTDPAVLKSDLPGKTIDPGRMGVYLCLLDEQPHLHPSLAALHKHRLAVHSIPLPADLEVEPAPQQNGNTSKDDTLTERQDVTMMAEPNGESDQTRPAEWVSWRFTPEEEARRRAYLPLS